MSAEASVGYVKSDAANGRITGAATLEEDTEEESETDEEADHASFAREMTDTVRLRAGSVGYDEDILFQELCAHIRGNFVNTPRTFSLY